MGAVIARAVRLVGVAAVICGGLTIAMPAQAEGLRLGGGTKSRTAQFQRQTQLMDSRLAAQYQRSARLQPGGDRNADTAGNVELTAAGVQDREIFVAVRFTANLLR